MSQVADKPPNIQEKIAEGKLNAWFGESVLLDQKFVKDETKTVREVILAVNSRTGENISVARFAGSRSARRDERDTGREIEPGVESPGRSARRVSGKLRDSRITKRILLHGP